LKSQFIGAEEYPPFLYLPNGTVKPEFVGLDPPLVGIPITDSQRTTLFAVGGDRVNSTPFSSMMNTLLLREHNRVAGELEKQNQNWDDERVFQTARNIMIPMFIKIVVEQYINHITPIPFNFVADPSVAWTANWNRPNWVTAEFSLLYRWHSLMPDVIDWQGAPIPIATLGLNNQPLLNVGLEAAFTIAADQPAAALGALNTNAALLPLERLAVLQARTNRLDTYNAYRDQFGLPKAKSFTDISSNLRIVDILQNLYDTVDDVEFYPGLFSEDRVPKCPLPGLLLRMVGVDAFSQALTNPLLSEHVFNEKTFTAWGLKLIKDTRCLGDLLVRQGAKTDPKAVTMTQSTWRYSWDMP
jgi:prostaglandin-endoperoxide synthase 2